MIKQKFKQLIYKLSFLINRIPFNNKIKLRGTHCNISNTILFKCKIDCRGNGNVIINNTGGCLRNCLIYIVGNNNTIEIGENTHITNGELWIEDDNNKIIIGSNTSLCGKIHLACIEGCTIAIGDNCLFSSDIVFRTGDSHSILDLDGNRINPAQDIIVKNHVWIGNKVIVTKGASIAENSIVGTGAIVTKKFDETNVVITGVPAKITKENINWSVERI
ncbi:MAG: acyltransferase [Clostridium sp.]